MDEYSLKAVATFWLAHEAHLARTYLASEGIESFVFDEHTVSINHLYANAVGGIKLMVRSRDVERALKVLGPR